MRCPARISRGNGSEPCRKPIEIQLPSRTRAEVRVIAIRGEGKNFSAGYDLTAALSGDLAARAAKSLAAGCDVVLHCNGKTEEMTATMGGVGALSAEATRRLTAAAARPSTPEEVDAVALAARLERLLDARG